MRRIAIPLLLLAVVACRQAEPPAAESTSPLPVAESSSSAPSLDDASIGRPEASLDPTGAYFAMNDLPPEFAELEHLSLATIDENAAPAPLNGFLRPKHRKAQDYVMTAPRLEGRKLTFRTEAVNGVHYEFDGSFTVDGDLAANPPGPEVAVLTGELVKLRDGKLEASAPVEFRYEAGG